MSPAKPSGQRQRSPGLSCLEGAVQIYSKAAAVRCGTVRCAGQHGASGLHPADAERDQRQRARPQDGADAAAPRVKARGLKAHGSASRSRSPTGCCSSPPTKPRSSPARSSSSTAAISPNSQTRPTHNSSVLCRSLVGTRWSARGLTDDHLRLQADNLPSEHLHPIGISGNPAKVAPTLRPSPQPSSFTPRSAAISDSFDDLVGAQQNRLRDRQPELFCGLEIDHQFESGRLLYG